MTTLAPRNVQTRVITLFSEKTGTSQKHPLKDLWNDTHGMKNPTVEKLEVEFEVTATVAAAAAQDFFWFNWPFLIQSLTLLDWLGNPLINNLSGEALMIAHLVEKQRYVIPFENLADVTTDYANRIKLDDDAAAKTLRFRFPIIDTTNGVAFRNADEQLPVMLLGGQARLEYVLQSAIENVTFSGHKVALYAHVRENRKPYLPPIPTLYEFTLGSENPANYGVEGLIRHATIYRPRETGGLVRYNDLLPSSTSIPSTGVNLAAAYTKFKDDLHGYELGTLHSLYTQRAFQAGAYRFSTDALMGVPPLFTGGHYLPYVPFHMGNKASEDAYANGVWNIRFNGTEKTSTDRIVIKTWQSRNPQLASELTGFSGDKLDEHLKMYGRLKKSMSAASGNPLARMLPVVIE